MQNVSSTVGFYVQRLPKLANVFVVTPVTVTGVVSQSTGTYFATASVTFPEGIIRDTWDLTYMNVNVTTQSNGIFIASFLSYEKSSRTMKFYVASWAPFTNYEVRLHIKILIPLPV